MIAVLVGFAAIVAVRGLGVSDFPDSLTAYAASGAILGGAVGIAQWLVLRRQIPNAWPLAGYWVLGSAAAYAIGLSIGFSPRGVLRALGWTAPNRLVALFLAVSALGALVGMIQWLALRTRLPRSGWWVLASAVGATLGLAAGEAAGGLGGVALNIAVLAAITGATLVWLLRVED